MIYKVKDDYDCDDSEFFLPGEVFEGEEYHDVNSSVFSRTNTGTSKMSGFRIELIYVTILADTWDEAREKYPEEFL